MMSIFKRFYCRYDDDRYSSFCSNLTYELDEKKKQKNRIIYIRENET